MLVLVPLQAAILLAACMFIWHAVTSSLATLDATAARLRRYKPDALVPLRDVRRLPAEVQPLIEAINGLIEKLAEARGAQQRFVANAAHQLRTPLASLKNEAELALAAPHPVEVHDTLKRLDAGAARAARMSSQLLALARSDGAAQAAIVSEALDLKRLVGEAASEWVPLAMSAQVDLGFELESAPLEGRRFLLRELLANLIHNAIEHAGPGARVTVRTLQADGASVLEVEDDGPGIPVDERATAFERFRRGSATAGAGSGLGLAIVNDIAKGHDANISLDEPVSGRGLIVRVRFPGPASAAGGALGGKA
jgi:two-component system sensor histidine kinase TctE